MPGLDGLRGYAVVAVVFGHAMNHENVAAIGVTVFFSLSGFLITSILMDEYARCGKIDVRAFILRRFWRLAPALLALLVVVASVLEFRRESLLPVLAAGTYVANVAAAASVPMRSLAHTWSLALEEQFYVVWPLVLGYFLGAGRRRALGWAAVSLAVASAACRIALLAAHHGQMATRLPVSRADAILVGCALAITWRRVSSLTRTLAGAGGVGILIAASFAPDIEHAWWGLMVAEAAATGVVHLFAVCGVVLSCATGGGQDLLRRLSVAFPDLLRHLPVATADCHLHRVTRRFAPHCRRVMAVARASAAAASSRPRGLPVPAAPRVGLTGQQLARS